MRELIEEVLRLQSEWTDENTPAMQRRGELVRVRMREWFVARRTSLSVSMACPADDVLVQASDGIGRKSEIPWIRFAARGFSPTPQEGWYAVYLFHARGEGAYLALIHGSTRVTGQIVQPRAAYELDALTVEARRILGAGLDNPRLSTSITLGAQRSKVAESYEHATAAAFWYPTGKVPSDEDLASDAATIGRLLGVLYGTVAPSSEPASRPVQPRPTRHPIEPDDAAEQRLRARGDMPATQIETLILARRGQGLFRERVLLLEPRCRVTGTTWPEHLRASHIKPWRDSTDDEKLDGNNGLMLAPHVDHLFDEGYISFNDYGDVLISPRCPTGLLKGWGIDEDANVGPFRIAQRAYLEYHRTKVLKP